MSPEEVHLIFLDFKTHTLQKDRRVEVLVSYHLLPPVPSCTIPSLPCVGVTKKDHGGF